MEIGHNIQQRREDKGMSQQDLADYLGISRQSISKWENGSALPSFKNVLALSDLFVVSLDELVKGDEALIEKFESSESAKITPANIIVITTLVLGVVTYIIEKIWLHIKVGTIDNGVELLGLIAFISLMITANWRDINKLFVKNKPFFWAMLAFVVILGVPCLTDFVQGFIDGFVAGAHAN